VVCTIKICPSPENIENFDCLSTEMQMALKNRQPMQLVPKIDSSQTVGNKKTDFYCGNIEFDELKSKSRRVGSH